MFSSEERWIYRNNPLVEVICQLRFPTILSVSAREPADFQEAIRRTFPRYAVRKETLPPKVIQAPGQPARLEQLPPIINYQFLTEDGKYRINLTQDFISLTCGRYLCWEEFAGMMDMSLAAFIKTYEPAYFQRVGLRYLNAFSRRDLNLEQTPWRDLIELPYLGVMAMDDRPESAFSRCSQDVEVTLAGGCRMKLHVGPGMIKRGNDTSDKEIKMIFDMDIYMSGNVPVNLAAGSMQTIHAQADEVFQSAVSDVLHDAMEPERR